MDRSKNCTSCRTEFVNMQWKRKEESRRAGMTSQKTAIDISTELEISMNILQQCHSILDLDPSILPRAPQILSLWQVRVNALKRAQAQVADAEQRALQDLKTLVKSGYASRKSCIAKRKETWSSYLILVCFGTLNVLCTDYNLKTLETYKSTSLAYFALCDRDKHLLISLSWQEARARHLLLDRCEAELEKVMKLSGSMQSMTKVPGVSSDSLDVSFLFPFAWGGCLRGGKLILFGGKFLKRQWKRRCIL